MKSFTRGWILVSMVILVNPVTAFAAPGKVEEDGDISFNFKGIQNILSYIINFLLIVAPALIILSLVASALMWTIAGHNKVMVERAKRQFVATCVTIAVIGGFFLIKSIILGLSLGSFGEGAASSDY